MRKWFLIFGFFFFFSSLNTVALSQNIREKNAQMITEQKEPLKAFQSSNRVKAEEAGRFVEFLLFGVVGAIVIAFFFIAYFHEQSEASKSSLNTKPIREPGIPRYRREREETKTRYEINDDE
jgi:hypothetical protein